MKRGYILVGYNKEQNCSTKFLPEEGSLALIINHHEEILSTLVYLISAPPL